MKFEKEIKIILGSRLENTDMINIMQALNYPQPDFQKAFDIALEMENRDLVKLLYSNFNANKIVVEFTRLGKIRS